MKTDETDEQLKQIHGLKWLPWIGKDYFDDSDKRMLIIGESHYGDAGKHETEYFTREIIRDEIIHGDFYRVKFYPNLMRTLFAGEQFNAEKFWGLISFYNFVQKPMLDKEIRPSNNDFRNGWPVFLKLIDVLKPKICLFTGTTAAKFFKESYDKLGLKRDPLKYDEKLNNAKVVEVLMHSPEGHKTELVFIKHPSMMYSWPIWNQYLHRKMPEQIAWLKQNVQPNSEEVTS